MTNSMNYKLLDNGIHCVVWEKLERESIDAYMELFQKIMAECPENSILRVLHDYRKTGTPSFNAMANGMKKLTIREDVGLRIAHIYSDSTYPMIVKNATLVARFNANRQFFNADEQQLAIEWLLLE